MPEGEGVLALQFTGGISDQKCAIWSVSHLFVHFLSANTVRLFDITIFKYEIMGKIMSNNKNNSDTWRFLPNTTRHHSAGCLCQSWLTGPLLTWLALLEELIRKTISLKLHAIALHALWDNNQYLGE